MLLSRLAKGVLAFALLCSLALRADPSRLASVSTLATAGPGSSALTGSFIVGSGSQKTVLIRAIGPSLGLSGQLATPVLTLYNSAGSQIATNSAWNSSDAGTMNAAGATALPSGSKDAAIVTTLAPGLYTAQISSSSTLSGLTRLEVYEVNAYSGSTAITAVATRSLLGSSSSFTTKITVSAGTGTRRLLVRAAGPALSMSGVSSPQADPIITLTNSNGSVIASNDDWGTPVSGGVDGNTLADYFVEAGASNFLVGSKDSALVVDLAPGTYTVQTGVSSGAAGTAQVEVYDVTPTGSGPNVVSLSSASVTADNGGTNPGVVVVTRSGDTSQPLTVAYNVGGSAVAGSDYDELSGSVTFPAGLSSAEILVNPDPSVTTAPSETVQITLTSGSGYSLGSTTSATVTIKNLPATLFVADLRASSDATGSTASGTASILLSASGNLASVNVSFSGLSSDEVVAHLALSAGYTGGSVVYLDTVGQGQVSGQQWNIGQVAQYSASQIVSALKSGSVILEIDSATYPMGELFGTFLPGTGSQTFVAPSAPPAINLSTVSAADAPRFLTQATFGVTTSDITTLTTQGYSTWINNQMALPATSHLAATRADAAAFPNTGTYPITQHDRQAAWWKIVCTAPDQLRQRVAFALSEIFVTSDVASSLANQPEGLANYYDMLANDSFGNFRTLLQDVTLSPVMGNYLNMLHNAKANPAKGTAADENYAREIMQLFTIGLNQLQPDGTLKLDSNGLPIPTYDQDTIVQTANVFTGWGYYSTAKTPSFYGATADLLDPMMLYPAYHDTTQKTIVGGVVLPANQDGATDLKQTLDTLFNHPNTGPMLAKGLIQRLVTSNPSPGYVYRVAQVFANDGTGTRGNLAAVVKAILTDYEARSASVTTDAGYGKLKEPLLRQTALYRAFNATAQNGRYAIFNPETSLGQAALRSPTVFNFFLPSYVPSGSLADAGLVGPEFQITTATTAISVPNALYNVIYTATTPSSSTLVLDISPLTTNAANIPAMLKLLGQLFCGGSMSSAMTQQLTTSLNALPKTTSTTDIARFALYVTVTSPEAAIQR